MPFFVGIPKPPVSPPHSQQITSETGSSGGSAYWITLPGLTSIRPVFSAAWRIIWLAVGRVCIVSAPPPFVEYLCDKLANGFSGVNGSFFDFPPDAFFDKETGFDFHGVLLSVFLYKDLKILPGPVGPGKRKELMWEVRF
jgi:hypothetical protein